MPYSEDDLQTLTEYRDGIVSALQKANLAIAELNGMIEKRDVEYEQVVPIAEERIKAVETARLDDRDPFEAARAEVREHLGPDMASGPAPIQSYLEEYDTRMKRAHRHLEEYLAEQKRARRVEQ